MEEGERRNEAFSAAIDERQDKLSGVMDQAQPITHEEAIEEAIREAHYDAVKRTASAVSICRHSVPDWDEELSAPHNERMRAKRYAQRN